MESGVLILAARKVGAIIITASCIFAGELFKLAIAQRSQGLLFLAPQQFPEGGKLELRSPDGVDCVAHAPERSHISLGIGVAEPQILNGISAGDFLFEPRTAKPWPVAGVAVTIPFGGPSSNCEALLRKEDAMSSVRKAQELFELGLINQDQMEAIAAQAYEALRIRQ